MGKIVSLRAALGGTSAPAAHPPRRGSVIALRAGMPTASRMRARLVLPATDADGGVLHLSKGRTLAHADGAVLGVAAFVIGVRSVRVEAPHEASSVACTLAPARLAALHRLTETLPTGSAAQRFALRFGTWLRQAWLPAARTAFIEERLAQLLLEALALCPAQWRRNTRFTPAVLDEAGEAFAVCQHQRRVSAGQRRQQALSALENDTRRIEDCFGIDLHAVVRLAGPVGPQRDDAVVFHGPLELAMRQLAAHFALPRLPYTWAELNAVLDYCERLSNALGEDLPLGERRDWRDACLEVARRHYPGEAPALQAFIDGDGARLRAAHASVIERLAAQWNEPPEDSLAP